ncbi:MAG: hypothetical protein OXN84_10975 [Albidovulum sp.]|nr:hypothetical protein [Albidovulum sp.]
MFDEIPFVGTGNAKQGLIFYFFPPESAAMYIKAAKTHMKGGEPACSYRLAESERVGGKVRQIALPDLGTGFSVPREKWRELRRPG